MRILLACIPTPGSRYIEDWKSALARHGEIVHDHEAFWSGDGGFDIVHIHWPEYLSFEIEAGLGAGLDSGILPRLEQRLEAWRSRNARIVVTRHNVRPHNNTDPAFERLYESVYARADAIVHLGEASRQDYLARYRGSFDCARQVQAVIPHAHFGSYANTVTRDEARRGLRIRRRSRTVLAFGGFTCEPEADLLMRAFRGLPGWNKTLLAPNWYERLPLIAYIRLKYWVRDLRRFHDRVHPWYRLGHAFVPEDRVQHYLNAADVLFVQRRQPLNSSNLVLGFTFGRVVVGPDHGNVGEILRETGNPTYDAGRPESAVAALVAGLRMAREGAGERNRRTALEQWDPAAIAARHAALYESLRPGAQGVAETTGMPCTAARP